MPAAAGHPAAWAPGAGGSARRVQMAGSWRPRSCSWDNGGIVRRRGCWLGVAAPLLRQLGAFQGTRLRRPAARLGGEGYARWRLREPSSPGGWWGKGLRGPRPAGAKPGAQSSRFRLLRGAAGVPVGAAGGPWGRGAVGPTRALPAAAQGGSPVVLAVLGESHLPAAHKALPLLAGSALSSPRRRRLRGSLSPSLGLWGGGSKLLGPDLHSGVGPESRFLIQPAGEGWPLRPTAGEDVPLEITDGDGDRSVLLCRERRGGAGLPGAQPGGSRAAGKGGAWRQQQQQAPAGTDVLQPVPTQRGIKERGATKSPKKCLSGISQLRLRRITGRTEA